MKGMLRTSLVIWLSCLCTLAVHAQAPQGTVERITVHSVALEGNLSGDSPDREVSIYLPPSYHTDANRRYPVIYLLHGFTDTDAQWFGLREHWITLPEVLNQALAEGTSQEMIVVMPNAYTRFKGSMYSTSVTIGDWETFIADELVAYIDSHYRTIPQAASRGLAGHSMGGYGTIRLGMKYPDVFPTLYLLSPCCMTPSRHNPEVLRRAKAVGSVDEIDSLSFFTLATLASAAAWAPNPTKPPFYLDLPSDEEEPGSMTAAKLAANATLVMIHQHIPNVRRLHALAMDVGTHDLGIAPATRQLHEVLDAYDIPHTYETYEGDHLNRIAERIRTKVLPFFSEHLSFD